MPTYLFDTDILIDFFKKRPYAQTLVTKLSSQGRLAASIITVAELRAGWSEPQAQFFLPRLYKLLTIHSLTNEIAEHAGKLRQEYKHKGITLPALDTLIAATALLDDCQLVTRNLKDYPHPDLS